MPTTEKFPPIFVAVKSFLRMRLKSIPEDPGSALRGGELRMVNA